MSIDENWQSSKITYLRLKSTKQSDIHKSKIENVKGQFSTDNEKRERNRQGMYLHLVAICPVKVHIVNMYLIIILHKNFL